MGWGPQIIERERREKREMRWGRGIRERGEKEGFINREWGPSVRERKGERMRRRRVRQNSCGYSCNDSSFNKDYKFSFI
jgi:hypothetical protein